MSTLYVFYQRVYFFFHYLFTSTTILFPHTSSVSLSALTPWFNTNIESRQCLRVVVNICSQPHCIYVHSPETFPLQCSHTLMLSHPLCVLLPPHTIPYVSLVCSCRESLSQLSLYGLKLPGQVYSTARPCTAGPG